MKNSSDNKDKPFLKQDEVKISKDAVFKIRIESAFDSLGINKEKFYEDVGISRQRWYAISWGIEPFPKWLKIKLCNMYGKPFIDFFLGVDFENGKG